MNCTSDPPNNHKCEMQYYGKKSVLSIKYDVCPGFDINIDNDIVKVFCSPPRDYSNYSYYKSFLFDENRNKSKMYLIKGDKVLILSSKIDGNNQEWYRIFYSGKKDIDMWIKADAVYLN